MDYLTHLLPITRDASIFGYLVIATLSFLESLAFIGLIIPGSVAVIIGGFLAARGTIDVGELFLFASLGAILGDSFSFHLGKKGIITFREENKIFKTSLLKKGEGYFKKHGNKSVFLGRFVGFVRPIVPFIAGLFNLDRKTFLFWNISSGLLWAALHIALGYFSGQAWETITLWSTRGSILIVVFVGSALVLYICKRLIVRHGKHIVSFLISVWHSIKQAIADNPDIKKLEREHTVLFKLTKGRLDKSKFSGLPATLLSLAFIYTVSLFIGIIEDIATADRIVSVDAHIANVLAIFRSTEATQFFLWITLLGTWQVVWIFSFASIGTLWIWHKRLYIAPLLLTIAGSEVFTQLGKAAFHRPRPELAIYAERSFSFPSGHATIAVAFYGFLTYVFVCSARRWKTKVNLFFAGVAIILLIGFSRLYLGVHYVSDVWGGYLTGTLWLIIGISISEWLRSVSRSVKKSDTSFSPHVRTYAISTVLILISSLFYIAFASTYHPHILQPSTSRMETTIQNINDIFSDERLKYTETLIGERQEPISFIILAENDKELVESFTNSGWFLADKANTSSVIRLAKAALLKQTYPQAPMTPSFWNTKTHNFGFEKPTESNNVRERHHARFWKTNYITYDGKEVYVGTASLDTGIKWGLVHKIQTDIDTEREFLFNDMKHANTSAEFKKQKFVEPTLGQNFSGDPFFTDGQAYIMIF